MFSVEEITSREEFEKLSNSWNILLAKGEFDEIFLTYSWVKSWLDSFWKNKELFFIVVKEGDKIAGIAPLIIVEEKFFGIKKRVLKFTGLNDSDYNDFIVAGDRQKVISKIFDYILVNKKRFDLVDLVQIPENSSTLKIFQEYFGEKNVRAQIRVKTVCPAHVVNKDSDSTFNKKSIRRANNALSKVGKVTFENIADAHEVVKKLPSLFEQHIKRRNLLVDKSLFLKKESRGFYEKLTWSLPSGQVLFSVLRLNDVPIAYHYGFVYNKKLIWYKPSFDMEYYKYSPGMILVKNLYQYVKKNSLNELDFTVGGEEFKKRFANKYRKNMRIVVYNDWGLYIFECYFKNLAKFILKFFSKK